jgi:hypothetical protein
MTALPAHVFVRFKSFVISVPPTMVPASLTVPGALDLPVVPEETTGGTAEPHAPLSIAETTVTKHEPRETFPMRMFELAP